jgi:alkylation response protein AidB-like acyl-CoA dehydrogenase
MDFAFTDEQEAAGALAAQVLGDASSHERLRELERSGAPRFDADLWSTLAEVGLTGLALPESAGGGGLGLIELGRVLVELGRTAAAVPLWETVALAGLPIARFAPTEIAARWLPAISRGDAVLTAAWHDEVGSSTTAEAGGSGVRLRGTKVCVPAAALAHAILIPARGSSGGGLYLVEPGQGVSVEPAQSTAGTPVAHVILDDAPAAVVGEGEAVLQWAWERAVATLCAVGLGNAEAMLRLLATYTTERKQFDVPIATFQAVGHRAADCYIDTEAIRLTTWQALSRLAEELPATAEVSIAKYWVAAAGHRIGIAAVHLHGGVGVDRDYPLARHFTRAKELELDLGGATEHLLRIGAELAG